MRIALSNHLLAIPYIYFPLIMILSEIFDLGINRNFVLDIPILVIGFIFAPIVVLIKGRIGRLNLSFVLLGLGMLFYGLIRDAVFGFPDYNMGYFFTLKPAIYFIVTGLILAAYKSPSVKIIISYGKILSIIIVLYFCISYFVTGVIARPDFTEDINYEAFLIFMSFCLLVLERGNFRFVKTHAIAMLATFSRTVMVAMFIFVIHKVKIKNILAILALLSASAVMFYISFLMRGSNIDLESVDRYSMLISFLEWADASNPFFYLGSPGGAMHGITPPIGISDLVESQNARNQLDGLFSFSVHSFFLRFWIDYGLIGLSILFVFIFIITKNFSFGYKFSIYVFVIVTGISSGVFYLSNVAFPLIVAISAIANKIKSHPV